MSKYLRYGFKFSDFHFKLASLAQQFLKPGAPGEKDVLMAMVKAWQLLELARVFDERGGDSGCLSIRHQCYPAGPGGFSFYEPDSRPRFEGNELLTLGAFAERVGIPRTTIDGYITDIEGEEDASIKSRLNAAKKPSGRKGSTVFNGQGLLDVLLKHPATRAKIERLAPGVMRNTMLSLPFRSVYFPCEEQASDRPEPLKTLPRKPKKKKSKIIRTG